MCPSSTFRSLIVALLLWSGLASAAGTGDEEAFRAHLDQAQRLFKGERYDDSISELRAAYAIKPLPRLLLNIGQLQRKLGRHQEALATYDLYFAVEREPPEEAARAIREYMGQVRKPETAPEPAPAMPLVPTVTPVKEHTPVYKRWWLWTAVGVGAAAVAGGVVAGVLFTQGPAEVPDPAGVPVRSFLRLELGR